MRPVPLALITTIGLRSAALPEGLEQLKDGCGPPPPSQNRFQIAVLLRVLLLLLLFLLLSLSLLLILSELYL